MFNVGRGYVHGVFVALMELFNIKNEYKGGLRKNYVGTSSHQEKEFFGGKAGSIYQRRDFKKGEINQNKSENKSYLVFGRL